MPFLATTIVGWAPHAMELIFLLSDLNPRSGQSIFHGGAFELGQLFVKLAFKEESLPEGVDGYLLMVERNGHLLSIEPSNVVTKWLATTFLDVIEIT